MEYGILHAYGAKHPEIEINALIMRAGNLLPYELGRKPNNLVTEVKEYQEKTGEPPFHDMIGLLEIAGKWFGNQIGALPEYTAARLKSMSWTTGGSE